MSSDTSEVKELAWELSYVNAGSHRLWPAEPTVGHLDLQRWRSRKYSTVLDAGCGDGKNLAYLVYNGFFVVGADGSKSALKKCESYLGESQKRNYVLLCPVPLENLPLMSGSIDAAICIDVLGHLQDPQPVLNELKRVIRPGGGLYANVFHPDDDCRSGPRMQPGENSFETWYTASDGRNERYFYRFYKQRDVQVLFESTGFKLVSLTSHRWSEPGHAGYREEPHTHESWFAFLEN